MKTRLSLSVEDEGAKERSGRRDTLLVRSGVAISAAVKLLIE